MCASTGTSHDQARGCTGGGFYGVCTIEWFGVGACSQVNSIATNLSGWCLHEV